MSSNTTIAFAKGIEPPTTGSYLLDSHDQESPREIPLELVTTALDASSREWKNHSAKMGGGVTCNEGMSIQKGPVFGVLDYLAETGRSLLFAGFDRPKISVKLAHFNPFNQWKRVNESISKMQSTGEISPNDYRTRRIDLSTGELYLDDSQATKRTKCFLLVLGTLVLHPIEALLNVINRLAKVVTFAHFWYPEKVHGKPLENPSLEWGKDLLVIVTTPIVSVGLLLSALYGLICPTEDAPHGGGKIYATLERFAFDGPVLANCFQPDPQHHFFGGDINQKDKY